MLLNNTLWSAHESQPQGHTRSKPSAHGALLHGNWQETEVLAMSQVTYASFSFQDRNSYPPLTVKMGMAWWPYQSLRTDHPDHPHTLFYMTAPLWEPTCEWPSPYYHQQYVCEGSKVHKGMLETNTLCYMLLCSLLLISKSRLKIQNKVIITIEDFSIWGIFSHSVWSTLSQI